MSRSTRREKAESELRSREEQFSTNLRAALRECAEGAWGLFGQNDALVADIPLLRSVYMEPAAALIEQGEQINRLRKALGYTDSFLPFERFMHYRQMKSANTPGEPKLAIQFLKELELSRGPQ
jgi:hypothetical protein